MILIHQLSNIEDIGGKAHALLRLQIRNTPPFVVVPAWYFEKRQQDPHLDEALREELSDFLQLDKRYAVRSSAIDEDSAAASFAGIHSSFLNVAPEAVFAHIQKVYDSAFTETAIEYRKRNHLLLDHIRMAVVIQEMVDADLAGVAFTIDPVTHDPDRIVISVTRGLGDKLVDGSVTGSTYTINGSQVDIQGEDILSKKQLADLLITIGQVSEQTDSFQDMEFAIRGNTTYFLQARPIAAYRGINPHERTLLLDNSNIIESYFGVTSPLTFSFAKDVYRDVYTATFRYGKVRESIIRALSPSLSEMLYQFDGRVYYNMNSWYHVTSIFPFKKSTSYMENMMGVKSGTDHFHRVRMNVLDMLSLAAVFVGKLIQIEKLSDAFEENFERIIGPYYGRELSGTNQELLQLFSTIEEQIVPEFTVPIVNDCAVMIFFGMLKEKSKKLNLSPEELNRCISSEEGVESMGSAVELVRLVEQIRGDDTVMRDFENLTPEELLTKYHNDTPLSPALQNYIHLYGPRVRDELKLETVTMIEDPRLLYAMLKENLQTQYHPTKSASAEIPKKIGKLALRTRKYIKNRERLRLKRTYVYSVVRNIFLAFGRNYCNDGKLDDPRDIFFLTKQEVFSGEGDLRGIVAQRKLQQLRDEEKPACDRVVFYGDRTLSVLRQKKGDGLQGIPGGGGKVTAPVSVMHSSQDPLAPGNIILTRRTDPGWITLFPKAGGLIVEHGSMLSHSFVVARELGLPAVAGVENATQRIPNGAVVTLDGTKGEITLADP